MPEAIVTTIAELIRQSPLLAVTVLVSWYYMRLITRQQVRELGAKSSEIERLLAEKKLEIDRILDERKKYFQLFLKELRDVNELDASRASKKEKPES